MARSNPSVPVAVESIISHNPAIYACMKERLINFHALASNVRREIEHMTGKPVSINTIVVAIKRFSDALEAENGHLPTLDILKDARLTLTSDVADITVRPQKSQLNAVFKRIVEISSDLEESPDIFKSSNLIKLVADEKEYRSVLRSKLGRSYITEETMGLSRLTLRLSRAAKRNSGLPLFISDLLYRNGINVIYSYIYDDITMIVQKEDGPKAYEVLEREIVQIRMNASIHKSRS